MKWRQLFIRQVFLPNGIGKYEMQEAEGREKKSLGHFGCTEDSLLSFFLTEGHTQASKQASMGGGLLGPCKYWGRKERRRSHSLTHSLTQTNFHLGRRGPQFHPAGMRAGDKYLTKIGLRRKRVKKTRGGSQLIFQALSLRKKENPHLPQEEEEKQHIFLVSCQEWAIPVSFS